MLKNISRRALLSEYKNGNQNIRWPQMSKVFFRSFHVLFVFRLSLFLLLPQLWGKAAEFIAFEMRLRINVQQAKHEQWKNLLQLRSRMDPNSNEMKNPHIIANA